MKRTRTRTALILTVLIGTLASMAGCWSAVAGAAAGGAVGYYTGKEGARNAD
jgi:hypothetical protein